MSEFKLNQYRDVFEMLSNVCRIIPCEQTDLLVSNIIKHSITNLKNDLENFEEI